MSEPVAAPAPRDAAALSRWRRRLARATEAPWLHREVASRMAGRLRALRVPPAEWLDWWALGGGAAHAVRDVLPRARRTAVEPDAALRHQGMALAAVPWWRRLSAAPVPAMLEGEVPPSQADMVFANMMLHAVPDPLRAMAGWHRALRPEGVLMFSTLGPDTLRELRDLYRDRGWPAPHAPFVDMHDLGDQLVQAGFADPVMDQELLRLSWSDATGLLAELRTLGGNAARDRFAGCRTPRWRDALRSALGELAGTDGRLQLSFEVVYGHAFKVLPRARAGQEVSIALEDVRSGLHRGRRASGAG